MANTGKKVIQYFCEVCNNLIDLKNEDLYTYRNKFYHMDCLTSKLKRSKKPKYTGEEIKVILEQAKERGKVTRRNEKRHSTSKPVKLPSVNKEAEIKEKQDMQQLIDYVSSKYRITSQSEIQRVKRTFTMIKNGTYKRADGQKIPYENMYNMFCNYEQELNYIHSRLKNPIDTQIALLYYDIVVLINKYSEYIYNKNHATKNENDIKDFEVSTYLKGRNIEEDDSDDNLDIEAFLEGY